MNRQCFQTIFLALAIIAWAVGTHRTPAGAGMAVVFLAAYFSPYRLHSDGKSKSRSNEATLALVILTAGWFWLQRQDMETNFALHFLSYSPMLLFPKLVFNALQLAGAAASGSPTRDGAAIAKLWLESHLPFSRQSLDLRRPLRFETIYYFATVFVASFSLPLAPSLACAGFGILAYSLCAGWQSSQAALPTAAVGALASFLALGGAAIGAYSLEHAQEYVDDYLTELSSRRADAMPSAESTDTSIGRRGRIDNGNKLIARLDWAQGSGYLRSGIFSYTLTGAAWTSHAAGAPNEVKTIAPGDGGSFVLPQLSSLPAVKLANGKQAKISLTFSRDRMAVPLPIGSTEIFGLPFAKLEVNRMGIPIAAGNPGFAKFATLFFPGSDPLPQYDEDDLNVPLGLTVAIDRFISESGARGKSSPAAAAAAIKEHFRQHWTYTLNLTSPDGAPRSLASFLTRDRQGHCEYFASATTLALRRLGIPARYTTGFHVSEFDQDEQLYWIRTRDAHAWTTYWDGSAWETLDATPPSPPDPLDFATSSTDWISRLQYFFDTLDIESLSKSIDTRYEWAAAILFALYLGNRMRLRRTAPVGAGRSLEADLLCARVSALTGLKHLPHEGSVDFWRRAAPFLDDAEGLIALANEREHALFMACPDPAPLLALCEAKAKALRRRLKASKS